MAFRLIIQRRFDQTGGGVRNGPESPSGIKRNRCPDCPGILIWTKAVQIRGIFHVYPLKLLAFWTSFDRF